MHYLCSYRPLVNTSQGRTAVERFSLPPFVEGSCRREPDFEAEFPTISALSRFKTSASQLQVGDIVIYLTSKAKYGSYTFSHWRLVAILKITKRFESHRDVAAWHQERGMALPRNCMAKGNSPLPYEMTHGVLPRALKVQRHDLSSLELVRKWDLKYRCRAWECGTFLLTKPLFLELSDPPIITEGIMQQVFNRLPGMQSFLRITRKEYDLLCELPVAASH